MTLSLLRGTYAVCKLPPDSPIAPPTRSTLYCLTVTSGELSLVCEASDAPEGARVEGDWGALVVEGPLDFGLTGVLASLLAPLAAANIPVFTISTYDTDILLVKRPMLEAAIAALEAAGHETKRP